MPLCALNQCLWFRMAVFLKQFFFERACINPNPDGYFVVFGRCNHFFNFPLCAYIARVNPQTVNPLFYCLKRKPPVKMDVCYHRDVCRFFYPAERLCRIHVRHCKPYDFASCLFKRLNLFYRCLYIPRVCLCHGLDTDRVASADRHLAYIDCPCFFTSGHCFLLRFSYYYSLSLSVSLSLVPS